MKDTNTPPVDEVILFNPILICHAPAHEFRRDDPIRVGEVVTHDGQFWIPDNRPHVGIAVGDDPDPE